MTDPPLSEPPVPTQLGEFRIESVLGEGGSGTVYAAHWGHREVALKVLRDAWLPSDGERRRFLDEARLLADVNHPGVVRILGFGELPDGRPYLAMERLEGESLAARLARGALAVERALELFGQLCQAVQTLHERGLIHRDIKPENVFLVRDEQYAVLLDFGIAKPIDAPDSTVTREGGVRGTPAYMAPERFFGSAANTSTDIYELGVVLFSMLTGRLPWDGANDPVTRLNPRRPSELGIPLPGALEGVLLETLASRAEGRSPTVMELAARVAQSVHEAPTFGEVRRTANLATASARMTAPGKGQRDVATAPTLRITPTPQGAAPQLPYDPSSAPIASYWSDSNPSIVAAELQTADPNLNVTTDQSRGPKTASPRDTGYSPARLAGPLRAATLGVGLPTPAGTSPVVKPNRGRLPFYLGGGLLLALLIIGATYLLIRPAPEQPLSVGATGLVRPPDPSPSNTALPSRRSIPAGRDTLVWRTHPSDTQVLARLSHDELIRSTVYKTLVQTSAKPMNIPQLDMLKKICHIDLLNRVEWLSVGLAGTADNTLVDFMLRGKWTRDEVERCVASLGKAAGTPWTVKRHGRVTRVELGGSSFWLGWPDSKTLFLSNRDAADQQWVQDRIAGKGAARESLALRRLYDLAKPSATLWAVINSAAFIDDRLFEKLPKPASALVNLWVAKDLKVEAVARYKSDKAALQARDGVRIQLHKLKSNIYVRTLLTKADITGTGKIARFLVYMDPASALLFAQAISSVLKSADLSSVTPKPKPDTDPDTKTKPKPRPTPPTP